MALLKKRGGSKSPGSTASGEASAPPSSGPTIGSVLQRHVRVSPEVISVLNRGKKEGLDFYRNYNDARLQLAFDSFDEAMRNAFFEILYLLHVNNNTMTQVEFTAQRTEMRNGVPKTVDTRETADLYVEGAPFGVKGINSLPSVFQSDFKQLVQRVFNTGVQSSADGASPIVCLQSIGSIGTVGHKSSDSDLDLQVVYDLTPGPIDLRRWGYSQIRDAIKVEQLWWVANARKARKIKKVDFQKPAVRRELNILAMKLVAKSYPALFEYMVADGKSFLKDLADPQSKKLRAVLLDELVRLVKRNLKLTSARETREKEALLKKRIDQIQRYIDQKYSSAEIYMFLVPLERYRAGKYESSLDFKESSGSAYELILNYETLMPGIQFTPTIPSHFVFAAEINNDGKFFEQLHGYMDIDALESLRDIYPNLVNLGNTPDMPTEYVANHGGAVYWEAFKASSGNLPKAILNLFRYEMLLDPRYIKTNIQIIKEPKILDSLVTPRSTDPTKGEPPPDPETTGVPNWFLLDMEQDHPALLQDPWWLRYKALKIGFCEPDGVVGLEAEERHLASRIIDLAFALHLRISDVFRKPGDTRPMESHREQVLLDILENAFPPNSKKREFLQHIFAGEISTVNKFENDLRTLFRRSHQRCQDKIEKSGAKGIDRNNEEIKLWSHYYRENFEPRKNVVQKTIMSHLKFARGRVKIGFVPGEGWFFNSLQKASSVGRRFDTFGTLDHLPEEVILVEKTGFIHGLATCILNGYYGIVNKGQLNETRTVLEFDGRHMDMNNVLDNEAAFIRPDHVERMMDHIVEFFPNQAYHYTDSIRVERLVKGIFLFLNVWKFGRLTVLYRDNLNTWFAEDIDNPELVDDADKLRANPQKLMAHDALHESLDTFLMNKRLYLEELSVKTWVNPNSMETTYSGSQPAVEERELAKDFHDALMKSQKHKK